MKTSTLWKVSTDKKAASANTSQLSATHVGAGLLAKASVQPTSMLNDTPLSRASPLPQGSLLN
ncbi:hypothetical protein PMI36_02891 [Pseudomonas sp. GM79]|nr:hypothetical protein PMI36_02891 [Pseudomonas sp. GM79]